MSAPALVILAAGASRRLGTCKALVRLREREPSTPLGMLLEAGAALGDARPLVVTGAHHEEISRALAQQASLELLHNATWAAGRTGGILRAALARPGRDLCLAPVDVPAVPREVFARLRESWTEAGSPALGWLAPVVEQDGAAHYGHPVILGRELLARAADWEPGRPLRELRDRAKPLLSAPVDAVEVLDDLDEPGHLAHLRARLA